MEISQLKNSIESGGFDRTFTQLYGSENSFAAGRYIKNLSDFITHFGNDASAGNIRMFSAPGRTEIGGNHTDHQCGCVLAGAVNLDAIAAVSKCDDGIIRVKSDGHNLDTINLSILSPIVSERGSAAALIRGVAAYLKDCGYNIDGFYAHTTSQVLSGSGLSSSAAFEILIGTILSHLYNDGSIDAVTLAKAGQYAENNFFGKPSGLMDQMAASVGGFVGIDFYDKANPVIDPVDFDFAAAGHALCIIDTKGSHSDLTDEYAAVMLEMKAVAGFFGQEVLSRVTLDDVIKNAAAIRQQHGDRAVIRSIHFLNDTKRAVSEKLALQNGDFLEFLRLVNESGQSSFMYLQNIYAGKTPETQEISLALAVSGAVLGREGAYRVHGGGFGGTIQAFVPLHLLSAYRETLDGVFGQGSCHVLSIRRQGGTEVTGN